MKPVIAILFAALVVCGCKPDESNTTPTAATTPPAAETKPASTPPADNNPKRKFQLRDLAVRDIVSGSHTIHAWIMDTDPKREEGMMWLKTEEIKDEQGMLFVFHEPQTADHGFWMHNTIMPLDIIYIDPSGKVVNVQEGKVLDETSLPAKGLYQYTLELKQGVAKKYGIAAGSKIEIPTDITASE